MIAEVLYSAASAALSISRLWSRFLANGLLFATILHLASLLWFGVKEATLEVKVIAYLSKETSRP